MIPSTIGSTHPPPTEFRFKTFLGKKGPLKYSSAVSVVLILPHSTSHSPTIQCEKIVKKKHFGNSSKSSLGAPPLLWKYNLSDIVQTNTPRDSIHSVIITFSSTPQFTLLTRDVAAEVEQQQQQQEGESPNINKNSIENSKLSNSSQPPLPSQGLGKKKLPKSNSMSPDVQHLRFETPSKKLGFLQALRFCRAQVSLTPAVGFSNRNTSSTLPKQISQSMTSSSHDSSTPGLSELILEPSLTLPIRFFCGTWNMGNAPPPEDLTAWIRPGHDLYICGFQESEWKPIDDQTNEDQLFNLVQKTINSINPNKSFVTVAKKSMWQMRLFVFASLEQARNLSHIHIDTEATGIAHVAANKGGILVSFDLYDSSFAFVSSHLNAHMKNFTRRNKDYSEIISGTRGHLHGDAEIHAADFCVWIGDLNYRIEKERDLVLKALENNDIDTLWPGDQLTRERKKKAAFVGFEENRPLFKPTYKFDVGNRVYAATKGRVPSWTDRILFKSQVPDKLRQTSYFCTHDEITTSDHSPVASTFIAHANMKYCPSSLQTLEKFISSGEYDSCPVIIFDSIKLRNLRIADVTSSDPYCAFFAPYLTGTWVSSCKKKCLNAEWTKSEVPALLCQIPEKKWLQLRTIHICVYDRDIVGQDDFMGQITLPLTDAFSTTSKTYKGDVIYGGVPHGSYEIRFRVVMMNQESFLHFSQAEETYPLKPFKPVPLLGRRRRLTLGARKQSEAIIHPPRRES